jgi:hypothetical protein
MWDVVDLQSTHGSPETRAKGCTCAPSDGVFSHTRDNCPLHGLESLAKVAEVRTFPAGHPRRSSHPSPLPGISVTTIRPRTHRHRQSPPPMPTIGLGCGRRCIIEIVG